MKSNSGSQSLKIVAIVALIIVGALMVAFSFTAPDGTVASVANLWDRPGPSGSGIFTQGLTGFLGAFQIALFAFVGAELVGTAVAETEHPERTLPKAINAVPFRTWPLLCAAAADHPRRHPLGQAG